MVFRTFWKCIYYYNLYFLFIDAAENLLSKKNLNVLNEEEIKNEQGKKKFIEKL